MEVARYLLDHGADPDGVHSPSFYDDDHPSGDDDDGPCDNDDNNEEEDDDEEADEDDEEGDDDDYHPDDDYPILSACFLGNLDLVELLTTRGADLTVSDHIGGTALMIASYMAHSRVVHYLVKQPAVLATVDAVSSSGMTALYMMCRDLPYAAEAVQAALNAGADPTIAVRGRKTPLGMARLSFLTEPNRAKRRGWAQTVRVLEVGQAMSPN